MMSAARRTEVLALHQSSAVSLAAVDRAMDFVTADDCTASERHPFADSRHPWAVLRTPTMMEFVPNKFSR